MYVRAILHLAATKTKFHHTSIPHDKANMSIMPISYHRHELHDGKLLHYLHLSAKFDDSGRILIEYWLGEVWPSKRVVLASNFVEPRLHQYQTSVVNFCIKMDFMMLFIVYVIEAFRYDGGRMICALQCIRDAWLLMQPSIGVVCNNEDYFVVILSPRLIR